MRDRDCFYEQRFYVWSITIHTHILSSCVVSDCFWCIPCYWQGHTAPEPFPLSFYQKTSWEYCKTKRIWGESITIQKDFLWKQGKTIHHTVICEYKKQVRRVWLLFVGKKGSTSRVNGDKLQVNYRDETREKVEETQKRGKERRSWGDCHIKFCLEFK